MCQHKILKMQKTNKVVQENVFFCKKVKTVRSLQSDL